uniref:Uncharacterized protein n=1 Tax=Glossina palpalis gambiensis TaxID=67801 RepID=A0A1B0B2D6_9MUSC
MWDSESYQPSAIRCLLVFAVICNRISNTTRMWRAKLNRPRNLYKSNWLPYGVVVSMSGKCSGDPDSLRVSPYINAANVEFAPYWPGLVAKALEGVNVKDLITNIGSDVGGEASPAAEAKM